MITLCVWCAQNLTLDANHTRAAVLYGELQLSFHRQLYHGQLRSLTVDKLHEAVVFSKSLRQSLLQTRWAELYTSDT